MDARVITERICCAGILALALALTSIDPGRAADWSPPSAKLNATVARSACTRESSSVSSPEGLGLLLRLLQPAVERPLRDKITDAIGKRGDGTSGASVSALRVWELPGYDLSKPVRDGGRRLFRGRFFETHTAEPVADATKWMNEFFTTPGGQLPTSKGSTVILAVLTSLAARWAVHFEPMSNGTFHGFSGDRKVNYIGTKSTMRFGSAFGSRFVEVPLRGGVTAAFYQIPKGRDACFILQKASSAEENRGTLGNVDFVMPTARVTSSWNDLRGVLSMLGLGRLLNGSAPSVTLFANRSNVSLDVIRQRSEISFDVDGVVARDATVTNVYLSGNHGNIIYLRSPFVFVVRGSDRSVLFQGIYG